MQMPTATVLVAGPSCPVFHHMLDLGVEMLAATQKVGRRRLNNAKFGIPLGINLARSVINGVKKGGWGREIEREKCIRYPN